MGGSNSKAHTVKLCEGDKKELSCDPGEVLDINEVTCGNKSCKLWGCSCDVSCRDGCDSKFDALKTHCQGKSSCQSPQSEAEFYNLCKTDGVSKLTYECRTANAPIEQSVTTSGTSSVTNSTDPATSTQSTDYESTARDILSTTSEWISNTSTNGRSTHDPNDSESVQKTQSFEDATNIDSVTGSAPLDSKIIAGAAVGGILLLLLLVLILIIIKRKRDTSTNSQQIDAEEKHNELYEMNANYTNENCGGNPGAYSTATDVANDVGDSRNVKANADSHADEADRDDPSERNMSENILYGQH